MKILVIDKTAILESSQEKCVELAKFKDVELTLFCPEVWKENFVDISLEKRSDINYRILTGKVIFKGYENRGFYYTGIKKAIKTTKPDIIFVLEEPFSFFALQTVFLRNKFCPTAKIVFYTWDNLSKKYIYPYKPSFFYELINRYVFKYSNYAMVANQEAQKILLAKGFDKPIKLIPYGVDIKQFKKMNTTTTRNSFGLKYFVIGYVGRLLFSKGVDILLKACKKLKDDSINNFSILIIGRGEFKQELIKISKEMSVSENLVLIEGVSHREVPKYLNCMDVLVLPSRTTSTWKEQFGRVIVEAMACEVPVVGSSSGAIPEVIGDAGLIFPEEDVISLKEKIKLLIYNPKLKESLVTKGKKRVLNYSWQLFAKSVYSIFKEIMVT